MLCPICLLLFFMLSSLSLVPSFSLVPSPSLCLSLYIEMSCLPPQSFSHSLSLSQSPCLFMWNIILATYIATWLLFAYVRQYIQTILSISMYVYVHCILLITYFWHGVSIYDVHRKLPCTCVCCEYVQYSYFWDGRPTMHRMRSTCSYTVDKPHLHHLPCHTNEFSSNIFDAEYLKSIPNSCIPYTFSTYLKLKLSTQCSHLYFFQHGFSIGFPHIRSTCTSTIYVQHVLPTGLFTTHTFNVHVYSIFI